ncbi:hypothetical protein FHR71_005348 [Methylobacterium sp. RAS18]|nr:hypothetical protein [Methylobacterium sp. RAS18]
MRLEALELLRAYASAVQAEQLTADHYAGMAEMIEEAGDTSAATAISAIARQHPIKALELQGNLAALSERYGSIFHQDL